MASVPEYVELLREIIGKGAEADAQVSAALVAVEKRLGAVEATISAQASAVDRHTAAVAARNELARQTREDATAEVTRVTRSRGAVVRGLVEFAKTQGGTLLLLVSAAALAKACGVTVEIPMKPANLEASHGEITDDPQP
jgi:hypothetical protein